MNHSLRLRFSFALPCHSRLRLSFSAQGIICWNFTRSWVNQMHQVNWLTFWKSKSRYSRKFIEENKTRSAHAHDRPKTRELDGRSRKQNSRLKVNLAADITGVCVWCSGYLCVKIHDVPLGLTFRFLHQSIVYLVRTTNCIILCWGARRICKEQT